MCKFEIVEHSPAGKKVPPELLTKWKEEAEASAKVQKEKWLKHHLKGLANYPGKKKSR